MAIIGPIPYGKTETIISRTAIIAGTITEYFHIESDSVLVSVFADVVSGTLDVSVYTLTEEGKEIGIITFPQLSAPTSELLLKKAAAAMSRIKVVATYSGATTFEVRARSIGAGESTVKILGASSGQTSAGTVTVTPSVLIAASLGDRTGLIIKNYSPSATIFLGYTLAAANPTTGYPLGPGESLGMDISSGVALYAVASAGTVDIRIMVAAF
jgi:hypothetical protein